MSEEVQKSLLLTPMSQVRSRRQEFLDAGKLIPIGAPTIFSGRGAVGKSTFALDYVAKVSTGTLEGHLKGSPRKVLLIQHEDDPATQVKPRLVAAGANLDNVITMLISKKVDETEIDEVPYLVEDMELIKRAVEETHAALIVIDPLSSSVGGDLHKVQDVRRALNPLAALAQQYELAIIALMHVKKGQAAAADKTSGSHAFRDAARSLLIFAHDKETDNRVVTVEKASYSAIEGESFAFALISTDVPTDDGNVTNVACVQILGSSDVSVGELWNREHDAGDGEERSEAQTWLSSFLTERGGQAKAADIQKASGADGFNWRTMQRAGSKLCNKESSGFQGSWVWSLKDDTQNPIGDKSVNSDNHANNGKKVSPLQIITDSNDCQIHGTPTLDGQCGRCLAGVAA